MPVPEPPPLRRKRSKGGDVDNSASHTNLAEYKFEDEDVNNSAPQSSKTEKKSEDVDNSTPQSKTRKKEKKRDVGGNLAPKKQQQWRKYTCWHNKSSSYYSLSSSSHSRF